MTKAMARSHQLEPKSNIRRRRTGCLTCRERRVRCGEEKPNCKNCSRKSRTCTWAKDGDRFLHHHLSASTLSEEPKQLSPIQTKTKPATTREIDLTTNQTSQISRVSPVEKKDYVQLPTPSLSTSLSTETLSTETLSDRLNTSGCDTWHLGHENSSQRPRSDSWHTSTSTDIVSNEEMSCWRSEVFESFSKESSSPTTELATSICRSQSARLKECIALEHSSPIPPNLEPNAELFSDWRTLGASETVVSALDGDKEMKLLQIYLRECAQWFDTFDAQRHYTRKDVSRMMTCPPWRAAALALSAKYTELQKTSELTADSLSLHLYQLAVQLAIDSISGRFDCVGTTAGCVVLAVYEMMTVTYRDWRRHLRGCTSIYSHNHWNGDSMGLIRASFWNYARIDVWAAFCASTETMLSTESWFNHPEKMLQLVNLDEDRYAHIATWLLARTNNMVHSSKDHLISLEDAIYLCLKKDLVRWEHMGSNATKPVMLRKADQHADQPFPSILFSSETSAIAYVMWHTAMVLILEFESSHWASRRENFSERIYEHASTVCGIVETNNNSSSVLVEGIHPLWICGRHLKTKSEKFTVLEMLGQIELSTGWKTGWRADSLREIWRSS